MNSAGDLVNAQPEQVRQIIRSGGWDRPTPGLAMGYAQTNLVILPQRYAYDFLLFCQRNPKPCPLLEVLEAGEYRTRFLSRSADLRTDIPRYNIYREGRLVESATDITSLWEDDFVSFLLGCSFSFEQALLGAGIPVRHIEEGKNVPMYITDIPCTPAGSLHGPMVVSMRPIAAALVPVPAAVTAALARCRRSTARSSRKRATWTPNPAARGRTKPASEASCWTAWRGPWARAMIAR